MPIAVSAIVNPSRSLIAATVFVCLCCAMIGVWLMFGQPGTVLVTKIGYAFGISCISFAMFGLCHIPGLRKARRIDISGNGQIRLMETGVVHGAFEGYEAELLPDSTLWPWLMVLRIRVDGGKRISMVILPDCMNRETFHQLKVACRWLVFRNERHDC